MHLEQIYTGCLAQGAYYIESNGEAAVIDPLRDIDTYISKAEKDGARIRYIFETHFHADFVSGHLDLARKTGATIVYGPLARPDFEAHIAIDGEQFRLGELSLTALHTPGHTMESTCYLLKDPKGKSIGLFTGDTLFIGDVGRPDLAQHMVSDLTQEKLAGYLYDSLHQKIMPLEDDLVIYPAHGAGSACGKNMSRETIDTLGHQKKINYALQPMDKETFIKKVTQGLTPPPAYFPMNVRMNIGGYEAIELVKQRGLSALTPQAFEAAANEPGTLILDTRDPKDFAAGFIPNAINIGLDGSFAPWAGTLIPDLDQRIVFIAGQGREDEVVTRLSRVGFHGVQGYLQGGIAAWKLAGKEIDTITSVAAASLAERLKVDTNAALLDVRRKSEYDSEHVIGAESLPLDYINDHLAELKKDRTYYVHCAAGYRSMIFVSILRARGYDRLVDVKGGFKAIKEDAQLPLSHFVPAETML